MKEYRILMMTARVLKLKLVKKYYFYKKET